MINKNLNLNSKKKVMLQAMLKMELICKMVLLTNIFTKETEETTNNGIANVLIMVNMRFKDFYYLIWPGIWMNSNLMDLDLMALLPCFIVIMVYIKYFYIKFLKFFVLNFNSFLIL